MGYNFNQVEPNQALHWLAYIDLKVSITIFSKRIPQAKRVTPLDHGPSLGDLRSFYVV